MPDTVPIAPADLLIDEENPRISQPNSGQHQTLQSLAQSLGPKLQALAADIVRSGLDPSNLPIVMPLSGSTTRHTVLEGNRRLAALRALENPDSIVGVVSPIILTQIRRLSKGYHENPVDQIPCVVVNDRDEARHWIELRHTGENAGAGVVPWGSDESARFRARTGVPEPHTQALDFLQLRGTLSAELRSKVPGTNFKRLIETPAVRAKLGIDIQKGTLLLRAAEAKVAKALMHVINDLVSGTTKVGDIYTSTQRGQYAAALPARIIVTATGNAAIPVVTNEPGTSIRPVTATRAPKKRDRLIPRDCALSIPSGRIQNIVTELQRKLSLNDHTNAVSVLFRVFIELSVDSYIATNLPRNSERAALQKKMEAVANNLVSRKKLTPKQRVPVSRACQKDSFLAPSITLMHNYVHNPHLFPAPSDLRAHWDSLQPFFKAVWTT